MINKIGIFGYGEFGQLLASFVPTNLEVRVCNRSPITVDLPPNIKNSSIEEVAGCDVVILAVPLAIYAPTLEKIKPYLKPDTLVVDVCSVKINSEKVFDEIISDHPEQLCLHPLFGPQSANNGAAGMPLVITRSRGERAKQFLNFCEHYLRLDMHYMSAAEHDREMALVHALTFFTARGLLNMGVHEVDLKTPSFKKLLELADLEKHHTKDLFMTIQKGNPYARAIRQEFLEKLAAIQKELEDE